MTVNKLKMNSDKTEVMLCGAKAKLKDVDVDSVDICDDNISFSNHVKKPRIFY